MTMVETLLTGTLSPKRTALLPATFTNTNSVFLNSHEWLLYYGYLFRTPRVSTYESVHCSENQWKEYWNCQIVQESVKIHVLDIFCLNINNQREKNVKKDQAWENSRHLTTAPMVSVQTDLWETCAEIPYWWHVTTQVSALVSQTPFRRETSGRIPKSWLFS